MDRWQKTSRRPRKKRRPDFVRKLTNWARYEPDPRYLKGRPTSLPYFRHFINDHKLPGQLPVERADLEHELDKIHKQGGVQLYGVLNLLLEYVADRAYLRGYLLNRDDQPATADEIARSRRIASSSEIREALKDLEAIGLIKRIPLEKVQQELRLAKEAIEDADRVPADRSAEGEPCRQGAPKEGRPPDGVVSLALEMNERRMKEVRGGRTDPPNYRKIWMAEAKRCLQAAIDQQVRGMRPAERCEHGEAERRRRS